MALNLLSHFYPYLNVTSFNHELHILYKVVSRCNKPPMARH